VVVGRTSDEGEAIRILDSGADDYLGYPLRPQEMLARIRAALRRHRSADWEARREWVECRFSGFTFYPKTQRLVLPSGRSLSLRRSEQLLLQMLIENPGSIVGRDQFASIAVEAAPGTTKKRTLDFAISRFRARVGAFGSPLPVRAIRGKGYILETKAEFSMGGAMTELE
jgi:two-component system phosphate regulon response regulator PhoB